MAKFFRELTPSQSEFVAQQKIFFVASAPLRQELAQFHVERLLAALKSLLPNDPITALRFEAAGEGSR